MAHLMPRRPDPSKAKDSPQVVALRERITAAFESETADLADHLAATADETVARALQDVVRAALGLEYDDWKRVWKVPEYESRRQTLFTPARVAAAAEAAWGRIDPGEVTLTAVEIERIKKAYRSAFLNATIAAAKTAGLRHAVALVSEATGVDLDEQDATERRNW